MAELGPVLVVIPTYQERENLRSVLTRLHAAVPDVEVLVVDDASPDGTGPSSAILVLSCRAPPS